MSTAVHPAGVQDIAAFHPTSFPLASPTVPWLTPNPDRTVAATLFYSAQHPSRPSSEKWYININDQSDTNIQVDQHAATTIFDMRGQEAATHIDVTGFQALTAPSTVSAEVLLDGSEEDVQRLYYPEVERLLLKHTGASRVVFFDHTIRKQREGQAETPATRKPVQRVHVDQTPASALKRVERHVQPPQPFSRVQIINVWRPIANTVYDFPLAVCDFRSVDVREDLVPTTLVYPRPTPDGETYSVKHSAQHRWYYLSEMTPDDVLFIKCYDSASRALTEVKASAADVDPAQLRDVAGLTPHTAFKDEEGVKKGIQRQSIEVRALVFYD